jgi:hypothetical protein
MAIFHFPERDPWPSVEEKERRDWCPHCDATPEERHQPDCPLDGGEIDAGDIQFCDSCGLSYVTECGCDPGDDE